LRLDGVVRERLARVLVFRVSEASATEVIIVASIVVPLAMLGIVSWFFWRASQRDRRANG
jgi:uncharacterized paraquat-inducible protein A